MKVDVPTKFMGISRVVGTSDGGDNYDYYRIRVYYDKNNEEWNFNVDNTPENESIIKKASSSNFADVFPIQIDIVQSRKSRRWYCNLVAVK